MVNIRLLKKEDIKKIVYLEETFLGETLGEEMLESELDSRVTKFYVATINDEVVGYIGRYELLNEAEVLNFVVDETYQRQGIGQMLFNKVEEDLPNLEKMTLEVRESNTKAKNFYTKNGFKQISIRKNYYKNNENALVLIKEYL
jgi:ribosomal-protein-alanine N-acetyltransferase